MQIYPAIDLRKGKPVRLFQGNFNAATEYALHPEDVAREYHKQGSSWLHIVDLDGAEDPEASQAEQIIKIANVTNMQVQVGGGIRSARQIEYYLSNGIARVIIGSKAVRDPQSVKNWIKNFGAEHIVIAVDCRLNAKNVPMVALSGWQEQSSVSVIEMIEDYLPSGLQHVLCTDIACDGALIGPNLSLYHMILDAYPNIKLQASGGVGDLYDVAALARLGCDGLVVGKALYENKFTLSAALAEELKHAG